MSLKVIGAGFGRTATHSLKIALEHILNKPCYHMSEVLVHQQHISIWENACNGDFQSLNQAFTGYSATVDWPSACFWQEILSENPDAYVLLSTRTADSWWESANNTIFKSLNDTQFPQNWRNLFRLVLEKHGIKDPSNKQQCIDAFNQHYRKVQETVSSDKLILWEPKDGWDPICHALDIEIPKEKFPLTNTSKDWKEREASEPELES